MRSPKIKDRYDVILSEAKGLIRRPRCFATLSMTTLDFDLPAIVADGKFLSYSGHNRCPRMDAR